MKLLFKTLLIFSFLVPAVDKTYAQTTLQNPELIQKYDQILGYYNNKEYDKMLKSSFKILADKKNSSSDYLILSYQTAFLCYKTFSNPDSYLKNEEVAKQYLDLSKQYLDLLGQTHPEMAKNVETQKKAIENELSPTTPDQRKEVTAKTVDTSFNKKNVAVNDPIEKEKTDESATNKKGVVDIISSGEGATLNLAINDALRKAIEKAFGVFVTSKTEIANERLISDQMATVASGNILDYNVISQVESDSSHRVTLSAKVSPENMVISYAKSGVTLELNGNVYYQNLLKEDFYKAEEPKILSAFYDQWSSVKLFDYNVVQQGEMYRSPVGDRGWIDRGTFYLSDMRKYQSKMLVEADENDYYWSGQFTDSQRLPNRFVNMDFYTLEYQIRITPNENYYNFMKSLVEILYRIGIKDVVNYKSKIAEPFQLDGYYYKDLSDAINTRSPYRLLTSTEVKNLGTSLEMIEKEKELRKGNIEAQKELEELESTRKIQIPSRVGQLAFRNRQSLDILEGLRSMVFQKASFKNLTIENFSDYTLPPSFQTVNSRYNLIDYSGESINNGGDNIVLYLPYPSIVQKYGGKEVLRFSDTKMFLSFTKEELPRIGKEKFHFTFD